MTLEEFRTLLDQALAFYNSEHSGAQIDEGVTGGLGAVRYDVAQVLAEAQKEQARKNIGIDELPTEPDIPGQFVAIFNVTTSVEIEAAYQAGQTVAILYDNKIGYLIKRSSATEHTFAVLAPYDSNIGGIPINILSCYDNLWGRNVLDAENTANKINTITATSDGTQYPSARAVIDYVDNQSKTFEAIFDVTTSAEIEAAYQAGKTITMNNNGVIYYLRERANSQLFIFTTAPFYLDIFQEINIYTATCNNSSWSMATAKAEAVSNKVTTIDANSTNKQYPSAKAVFDYVQNNSGGGGSGADLLNADGIIKQQYFPEGYPYSEIGEGIVLPETSYTANDSDEMAYIMGTPLVLVIGQEYTVNWNGTEYTCTALDSSALGEEGGYILGNVGAMTGGEDTGEPFILVIPGADTEAAQSGIAALAFSLDGSTEGTVSISGMTELVTPIDRKYLGNISEPFVVKLDVTSVMSGDNLNFTVNSATSDYAAVKAAIDSGKCVFCYANVSLLGTSTTICLNFVNIDIITAALSFQTMPIITSFANYVSIQHYVLHFNTDGSFYFSREYHACAIYSS